MRTILGLLFVASLACGCGGGGRPSFNPPLPDSRTIVYGIEAGAPTLLVDSTNPGYAITANVGNSYRLVWTGNATYSGFRGYIIANSTFTSYTPGCGGECPLESNDFVSSRPYAIAGGGQEIDFDAVASDGIDGIDFTLDANNTVYFYMEINGGYHPELVYFTTTNPLGQVSNPEALPFGVSTD